MGWITEETEWMDDSDVYSLRNRCVARLQQLGKMRWVLAVNLIFSVRDLLKRSRV